MDARPLAIAILFLAVPMASLAQTNPGGTGNQFAPACSAPQNGPPADAFIGAGVNNFNGADQAAIVAGSRNTVDCNAMRAFIGAGARNQVGSNQPGAFGEDATVLAGTKNLAMGRASFVGAGEENEVTGEFAVGLAGTENAVAGRAAMVAAGRDNIAGMDFCFVGAGQENECLGIVGATKWDTCNDLFPGTSMVPADLSSAPVITACASLIGGGTRNVIEGASGAVIGGGIDHRIDCTTPPALVRCAHFSFVGAGVRNQVQGGTGSAILAGVRNLVTGDASFVGAGRNHQAQSTAGFIGGGQAHVLPGTANQSAIVAGANNVLPATDSVIGSGLQNTIPLTAPNSIIGGGRTNLITGLHSGIGAGAANQAFSRGGIIGAGQSNAIFSDVGVIGGGFNNTVSAQAGFIGSGTQNVLNAPMSIIGAGHGNRLSQQYGVIGGGHLNTVLTVAGTVGGGVQNTVRADYATIPGGKGSVADIYGQYVTSAGGFPAPFGNGQVPGSAQRSLFVLRNAIDSGASTSVELFTDGEAAQLVMRPSTTWAYTVLCIATDDSGATSSWDIKGAVKSTAAGIRMIGSPSATVLGADPGTAAWNCDVGLDTTTGAFTVTGTAAGAVRFVATVHTVEVTY